MQASRDAITIATHNIEAAPLMLTVCGRPQVYVFTVLLDRHRMTDGTVDMVQQHMRDVLQELADAGDAAALAEGGGVYSLAQWSRKKLQARVPQLVAVQCAEVPRKFVSVCEQYWVKKPPEGGHNGTEVQ